MAKLSALDYTYDDLAPATAALPLTKRLERLGVSGATVKAMEGVAAVSGGKNVELVGANQGPVRITGGEVHAFVQLDKGVRRKISASLAAAPETLVPDRVFLNLENVRGISDATAFRVYVGLAEGANPSDHPELLAGNIALFGVRKASMVDDEHAGKGLTFVLEITKIVDGLHLNNALDVDKLNVRIVPTRPVHEDAQITIGRISIFREGL
jgi:tyrosinase